MFGLGAMLNVYLLNGKESTLSHTNPVKREIGT